MLFLFLTISNTVSKKFGHKTYLIKKNKLNIKQIYLVYSTNNRYLIKNDAT